MPKRNGAPGQRSLFGEPAEQSGGVLPADPGDDLRAVSRRLPESLHLGTSSWSFPGWSGIVYGAGYSKARLAREGLAAYARHPLLRSVGIDRTYYAPLPASALAAYAEQVPSDFRFLVKAHEACTLPRFPGLARYGDRAGARNDVFLDASYAVDQVVGPYHEGLGERAGVLLFQFSPQAVSSADGATADGGPAGFAERLHRFLARLPSFATYAVELRTPRLVVPEYFDALADAGAVHCLNAHPSMPPIAVQAGLAKGPRAAPLVVRWMLHSGLSYEQAVRRYEPFDRVVEEDAESRGAIAGLCREAAAAGRKAFVIANNKAEGSAPLSIFALARDIAGTE